MSQDAQNPTRKELQEHKDIQSEEARRLETDLEKKAEDIHTIRELDSVLDLDGGTSEGVQGIQDAVEGAEHLTEDAFDEGDAELSDNQEQGDEFRSEVEERREGSERNLGHLSDSSAKVTTDTAVQKLRESKEAALEDQDMLIELESAIEQSVAESQQVLQQLRQIRNQRG